MTNYNRFCFVPFQLKLEFYRLWIAALEIGDPQGIVAVRREYGCFVDDREKMIADYRHKVDELEAILATRAIRGTSRPAG